MATSCNATVLIVDDSADNLGVLHALLSPEYRVSAATNGPAAVRIALAQPKPDLIRLDVMMPAMVGYAFLGQLRANNQTQDIAVFFLTALDSPENEEYGLQLGAADYITKPITPLMVLARVRTQLLAKSVTAATARAAQEAITRASGKHCDPDVVQAFLATFGKLPQSKSEKMQPREKSVAARELKVGMVLAHDIITPSGMLMLSVGHEFDDHLTHKILEFQSSAGLSINADVRLEAGP